MEEQKINICSDKSAVDLREYIVEAATGFKKSWIKFGQALYSVWRDKLYLDWEFATFDAYLKEELMLSKKAAVCLLRDAFFIEQQIPKLMNVEDTTIPTQDVVTFLRQKFAHKDVHRDDYYQIEKAALDERKPLSILKKDLKELVKKRDERSPEEVRAEERQKDLTKFINQLVSMRKEVAVGRLSKAVEDYAHKIEDILSKELDSLQELLTQ